jgi:hypothetical protein
MSSVGQLRNASFVDRTVFIGGKRQIGSPRPLGGIDALVLHQTGFNRGNITTAYDKMGVHYVILPDGTILQLYVDSAYLHASSALNRRSVAVEFVGNFPLQSGKWWRGSKSRDYPTQQQISSGRLLVIILMIKLGITHVLAHRQGASPSRRGNCPGPHIWYNVGEWAKGLGLSDGGAGFAAGRGGAIPKKWRNESFDLMKA